MCVNAMNMNTVITDIGARNMDMNMTKTKAVAKTLCNTTTHANTQCTHNTKTHTHIPQHKNAGEEGHDGEDDYEYDEDNGDENAMVTNVNPRKRRMRRRTQIRKRK